LRTIFIIILAGFFLLAAGGVLAYLAMFPAQSWRYKMTVVVETPEGIKAGSAVREVHARRPIMEFPNVTSSVNVKGEAVAIDLGKRGILFALLSGYNAGPDHSYMVVFRGLPFSGGGGFSPEGIRYYRSLKNAQAVLQPTDYPVLVMFKDIQDPKTVTPVLEMKEANKGYPLHYDIIADHFEELFGKGVRLKEISIEMTDEKVTWKISEYLPWLPEFYNKRLDGQRFGSANSQFPFANRFSSGAFSTGENK
jgi:hypothetical protein